MSHKKVKNSPPTPPAKKSAPESAASLKTVGEKIAQKIRENPSKAATLLTDWIRRTPHKKQKAA